MKSSIFATSEALSRLPLTTCERCPGVMPWLRAQSRAVERASASAASNCALRTVDGVATVIVKGVTGALRDQQCRCGNRSSQEESAPTLQSLQVQEILILETPGQRVFRVRLARGDGVRRPQSQRRFAAELNKAAVELGYTDRRYDSSEVSRMETGGLGIDLVDGAVVARIDPMKRGLTWLALGITTIYGKLPAGLLAEAEESTRRLATGDEPITRSSHELPDEALVSHTERQAEKEGAQRRKRASGESRGTRGPAKPASHAKPRPRRSD
jgi:hypothetical protein